MPQKIFSVSALPQLALAPTKTRSATFLSGSGVLSRPRAEPSTGRSDAQSPPVARKRTPTRQIRAVFESFGRLGLFIR